MLENIALTLLATLGLLATQTGCPGPEATPPDDSASETGNGDGDGDCLGSNDCFDCEPTNSIELTNACTDATCEAFDNQARLPLLEGDGTLPPLP